MQFGNYIVVVARALCMVSALAGDLSPRRCEYQQYKLSKPQNLAQQFAPLVILKITPNSRAKTACRVSTLQLSVSPEDMD